MSVVLWVLGGLAAWTLVALAGAIGLGRYFARREADVDQTSS